MARGYSEGRHARYTRASNRAYDRARAEGIARGIREMEQEDKERRERIEARLDRERVQTEARYEREDINRERYHAGLPRALPEERIAEAQAGALEVQAAEAERIEESKRTVWEFTPQQNQRRTMLQTAREGIQSNPDFSPDMKVESVQKIDADLALIKETPRPRRPDEPWYQEGQGPDDTWLDPLGTGALIGRNKDGKKVTLVQYKDTQAGIEAKVRMEFEEKQREAQGKREAVIADQVFKWKTELIQDTDAKGDVTGSKRYRTPNEVRDLALHFPEIAKAHQQAQQEAAVQRRELAEEPPEVEWARKARKTSGLGLKVRAEAKRIIAAWEYSQRGQAKPITEDEFNKLPPGATFLHPDGTTRRKP